MREEKNAAPAAVAVPDVEMRAQAAPRIQRPYTLAEIKAKIASNDYSAELLLQHAMLLLEGDAAPAAVTGPDGWRKRAEHSYTEPSPMAKVAAALRQKAEQEDAAYQARRSDQGLMESEWGPMEDAPPNEDPPMHVAVVEGDDAVRTLQWNRDVAAFAYPVGTLLYAARSQAKKGGA